MDGALPPLIKLPDWGGDWDRYVDALYGVYVNEIVNGSLSFRSMPIRLQTGPSAEGKAFAFWHLVGEGPEEDQRTPDFRRCERLGWIAWMIRQAEAEGEVVWWENRRQNDTHVVLWHRAENFVVVLAKRRDYYVLKTAYVLKPHRAAAFQREWKDYWEKG